MEPDLTTDETPEDALISQCPEPCRRIMLSIANDLKTQITPLKVYLSLLQHPGVSEDQKAEYLERMQYLAQRLLLIAKEIDRYTRKPPTE